MRIGVVVKYIGVSLMLVSGFMLLSALVALLHGGDDSIIPLLYSGVVTRVLGIFPSFFVRRTGKLSQREG